MLTNTSYLHLRLVEQTFSVDARPIQVLQPAVMATDASFQLPDVLLSLVVPEI